MKKQSCLHCAFSKILFLRSSPLSDWQIAYSNTHFHPLLSAHSSTQSTKKSPILFLHVPRLPSSRQCRYLHLVPFILLLLHHPPVPSFHCTHRPPCPFTHCTHCTHRTHRTHRTPPLPIAPLHRTHRTPPPYPPYPRHRTTVPQAPYPCATPTVPTYHIPPKSICFEFR